MGNQAVAQFFISLCLLAAMFMAGLTAGPAPAVAGTLALKPKSEPYYAFPKPLPPPIVIWQDATGDDLSLRRFLGQVVVLNFWATWCAPCVMEMPSLDALQKRYRKAGLKVVAVSLDKAGYDKIRDFYLEHNIRQLDIFSNPDATAPAAFKVRSLPTSFIINRQGQLVGLVNGYEDWDEDAIRSQLELYLREDVDHAPTAAMPAVDLNRKVIGVDE